VGKAAHLANTGLFALERLTKGLVSHLVRQFGVDITIVGERHLHDLYRAYFGCTEQCLLSLHCDGVNTTVVHL